MGRRESSSSNWRRSPSTAVWIWPCTVKGRTPTGFQSLERLSAICTAGRAAIALLSTSGFISHRLPGGGALGTSSLRLKSHLLYARSICKFSTCAEIDTESKNWNRGRLHASCSPKAGPGPSVLSANSTQACRLMSACCPRGRGDRTVEALGMTPNPLRSFFLERWETPAEWKPNRALLAGLEVAAKFHRAWGLVGERKTVLEVAVLSSRWRATHKREIWSAPEDAVPLGERVRRIARPERRAARARRPEDAGMNADTPLAGKSSWSHARAEQSR